MNRKVGWGLFIERHTVCLYSKQLYLTTSDESKQDCILSEGPTPPHCVFCT